MLAVTVGALADGLQRIAAAYRILSGGGGNGFGPHTIDTHDIAVDDQLCEDVAFLGLAQHMAVDIVDQAAVVSTLGAIGDADEVAVDIVLFGRIATLPGVVTALPGYAAWFNPDKR